MPRLAARLGLDGFFPGPPTRRCSTRSSTIRRPGMQRWLACRNGGIGELRISPSPIRRWTSTRPCVASSSGPRTRSGWPRCRCLEWQEPFDQDAARRHPLTLTQGRTLAHFHGFYNNGRELPTLARRDVEPRVWDLDRRRRGTRVSDSAHPPAQRPRRFAARARVTDRIPAGIALWPRRLARTPLTDSAPVPPDAAVDRFAFSAGQSTFNARVEVSAT